MSFNDKFNFSLKKKHILRKVHDIIFIASNLSANSCRNRYCEMMLTSHRGRHIRHNRRSLTGVDRERCKFRVGSPVSVTTDNFISQAHYGNGNRFHRNYIIRIWRWFVRVRVPDIELIIEITNGDNRGSCIDSKIHWMHRK